MATIRRLIGGTTSQFAGISTWSSDVAYSIDDGNIEIGVIHEDGLDLAETNNAYIGGTNTTASAYKKLTSGKYDTLYKISGSGTGSFNVTIDGITYGVSGGISNPAQAVAVFTDNTGLTSQDVQAIWFSSTHTTGNGIIVDFGGSQNGKVVTVTQTGGGFAATLLCEGGGHVANGLEWTGAKIRKRPRPAFPPPSGNEIGMLYIDAPYTRVERVHLHVILDDQAQENVSVTQYGMVVSSLAAETRLNACSVVWPYGFFTDTAAFVLISGSGDAVHAHCYNCVAIGGFDQLNNSDRGFYHGFLVFGQHRVHNALVVGARGFSYELSNAALNTGHKNCMSFRAGSGGWLFGAGEYSNTDYLMSDGNVPTTNLPSGYVAYSQVDPGTIFHDLDHHDFRLIPTSGAVDAGTPLLGITPAVDTDFFGQPRLGTPDIGPVEGYSFPETGDPDVEEVDVAGQTELNNWLADTRVNLVALNQIKIARLSHGAAYQLPAAITGSCGDVDRYRMITAQVDEWYDPLVDYGAKVELVKSAVGCAIYDHGFRLSRVRVEDDDVATAVDGVGLRFTGREAQVNSCYVWHHGTVGSGIDYEMIRLDGYRALAHSNIVKSETNPSGTLVGIRALQTTTVVGNNVLTGMTYGYQGGGTCANNIAFLTRVMGFYQTTPSNMFNNMTDDSSASGLVGFNGVPPGSIFYNLTGEDYRLKVTSPAVNAGRVMDEWYTTDYVAATRRYPWDLGPYDGIVTGPELPRVTPRTTMRLANLFNVERQDGVTLYLSDASSALAFRGNIYYPENSARASARRQQFALEEASFQLEGGISSSRVSLQDLIARRYDDALVTEFQIDWKYPFARPYVVRQWYLKEVEFDRATWRGTLIGVTALFANRKGRKRNRQCDANLGDSDCKVDLGPFTYQVTVDSVSSSEPRRRFSIDSVPLPPEKWFTLGHITWTTGDNIGLMCDIKEDQPISGGRGLTTQLKTPFDIQVGDTATLVAGCNKLYGTCGTKFNNKVNFQGEPYLRSTDKLWDTPTSW